MERAKKIEDEIITCPYRGCQIASRGYLQHYNKCKDHPDSIKLTICKYNLAHRIVPELYDKHLTECADFIDFQVELSKQTVSQPEWDTNVAKSKDNNDDDQWGSWGSSDAQPFYAPGLGGNKKAANKNPASITPLEYQAMAKKDRRQFNEQDIHSGHKSSNSGKSSSTNKPAANTSSSSQKPSQNHQPPSSGKSSRGKSKGKRGT